MKGGGEKGGARGANGVFSPIPNISCDTSLGFRVNKMFKKYFFKNNQTFGVVNAAN